MERMTIKAYATKHKLSIFNVVKMVKSGQLKSEIVEEDGKEVTYVIAQTHSESMQKEESGSTKEEPTASLEEKVARLEQDVAIMKRELDALKMSIGIR
jgi:uncharacterized protein YceH (UPF0502 family)